MNRHLRTLLAVAVLTGLAGCGPADRPAAAPSKPAWSEADMRAAAEGAALPADALLELSIPDKPDIDDARGSVALLPGCGYRINAEELTDVQHVRVWDARPAWWNLDEYQAVSVGYAQRKTTAETFLTTIRQRSKTCPSQGQKVLADLTPPALDGVGAVSYCLTGHGREFAVHCVVYVARDTPDGLLAASFGYQDAERERAASVVTRMAPKLAARLAKA